MPAQWTGDIIGRMHISGITARELADKVNWHPKYLSAVLNGHRQPKNAEQVLREALDEMTLEKEERR